MSNQSLVYAAIVLGTIGAYGTLSKSDDENIGGVDLLPRILAIENWKANQTTRDIPADATTSEILDNLKIRTTDVEILADQINEVVDPLVDKVDINISDIHDVKVDFQTQISENKGEADSVSKTVDGILSDITDIITPQLESLDESINGALDDSEDLGIIGQILELKTAIDNITTARITEAGTRSQLSTDLAGETTRITANLDAINDIDDDLINVYDVAIKANKDNIITIANALSTQSQAFNITEESITCYKKFKAHYGVDLALSDSPLNLRSGNDGNWQLYFQKLAGVTNGESARLKVWKNAAFVVENSNGDVLTSSRASDGLFETGGDLYVGGDTLKIADYCSLGTATTNPADLDDYNNDAVYFAHKSCIDFPAIYQQSNGNTTVFGNMMVKTNVTGFTKCATFANMLAIYSSSDDCYSTYFAESSARIATKASGSVSFHFGKKSSTVKITDGEINIDGTNVLAKLNSLQSQIDQLETDLDSVGDDYIKHGAKIRLNNSANGNRVRKGTTNNDIICDNTTDDAKSQFTITVSNINY